MTFQSNLLPLRGSSASFQALTNGYSLLFAFGICALLPKMITLAIYLGIRHPLDYHFGVGCQHTSSSCAPPPNFDPCSYRLDRSSLSFSLGLHLSILLPTSRPRLFRSLAFNVVVFRESSRSRLLRHASTLVFVPITCTAPTLFVSDNTVMSLRPRLPLRNATSCFKHFATLKDRALRLQRRADQLRHAQFPPPTGQKGEIHDRHKQPYWVRKPPRQSPRNAKYCPVAAANSPNPFALAPLTIRQRAAANKILSHVHLACHSTPLRMALQAPSRMRDSLGPTANTSPIIWDSGASILITPDLSDFLGPVTPPGKITQLKGIAKGFAN